MIDKVRWLNLMMEMMEVGSSRRPLQISVVLLRGREVSGDRQVEEAR
jgi:hypothetical protein